MPDQHQEGASILPPPTTLTPANGRLPTHHLPLHQAGPSWRCGRLTGSRLHATTCAHGAIRLLTGMPSSITHPCLDRVPSNTRDTGNLTSLSLSPRPSNDMPQQYAPGSTAISAPLNHGQTG